MLVHDNGMLNVLSENRCGNTSMYHYFGIPIYSQMLNTTREKMRSIWKQNPSEKIIVLRDPYQRCRSAINYHKLSNYYHRFFAMDPEERKEIELRANYPHIENMTYEQFRLSDIRGHCAPYLNHLIGFNFRYIDFNRIGEYLNVQIGPITDTVDETFSEEFLDFYDLDNLKFEKFLYQEYLFRFKEITPEEWKEKTK